MKHCEHIKVLLVEDDPDDAELLKRLLRKITSISIKLHWESSLSSALEALSAEMFDVIVTDLGLPESSGIDAFLRLHAHHPDVPVIVLTGLIDEEAALEAVQKGAQDYLLKGQIDGAIFVQSVRYAIERQKLMTQLGQSLKAIKTLEGLIPICAWCKQIRDDRGYWKKVETYIEEHTGAAFSHGICPECLKKNYPGTFEKAKRERADLLCNEKGTAETGTDKYPEIRVLLIEDDPADAELIRRLISRIHAIHISVGQADRLALAVARLDNERFDLVLSDLGLPDSQGIATFIKVHTLFPEVPVIITSGLHDEETAMQAVRSGAQDYVVKGKIDASSLLKAIRYAIERQKLTTKLGNGLKEIRRLENERRVILSMFAHDIGNVVESSSKLLTRTLDNGTGDLRDSLPAIADRLMSIEGLLTNLVDYSRFETYKYRPVMGPFDLAEAIQNEIGRVRKRAVSKNISISCDTPDGPAPVTEADGSMVQKVISNLFDNAIKYMHNNGRLSIRTNTSAKGVLVQVRDTGIGIAGDQLPYVFNAFYRADASAEGFGLGLSVAKTIIEAHGGKIWAESNQGEGSTFSFILPAK